MNEWQFDTVAGQTLYLVLYNQASSKFVNGTALEVKNNAHWTNYAIPLIDAGGVGVYIASQPAVIAGTYMGTAYRQLGGTPAITDPQVGFGGLTWDGSGAVSNVTTIVINSYNSVATGDTYFGRILYNTDWVNASTDAKQCALNQANEVVEQYAYAGERATYTQSKEWPRKMLVYQGTEGNQIYDPTVIPQEILIAELLIAQVLLGGYDPEQEARNRGISSRRYASVSTTYDTGVVPEYVQAQCPSAMAWAYLRRFIHPSNTGTVAIRRV